MMARGLSGKFKHFGFGTYLKIWCRQKTVQNEDYFMTSKNYLRKANH